MKRRSFLGGAAMLGGLMAVRARARAAGLAMPTGVPSGRALGFDVVRHDSVIGTHRLAFRCDGHTVEVRIAVALAVSFGPITLYRYRHDGIEIWRDGTFSALDTLTNDNGTQLSVRARRTPAGVVVQATRAPHLLLPPTAIPLTHWNRQVTTAPLFDPQDGAAAGVQVTPAGADRVAGLDGRLVAAQRFDFAGRATLSDWYDSGAIWTALRAVASDKSILTYHRTV